jgi:hypothetical protein
VSWPAIFLVFAVSHMVGDFVLQTDWQATHKTGGLGPDPEARRALVSHLTTYTLAFVPALVWVATDIGAWAIGLAAVIAIPHLIQDDGRLVSAYIRRVKKVPGTPEDLLYLGVDQSLHAVALLGAALLATL